MFCLGQKKGFTLVEVLITIAILGILSAMGVSNLMGAAENARVDGVAKRTVAFMERMGKESKRMSTALCLKMVNDTVINVYKSDDCSNPQADQFFDYMKIESPMRFVAVCPQLDDVCDLAGGCEVNLLDGTSGVFRPRIGLASLPVSGYVCAQYGSSDHYAMALKSKESNFVKPLTYEEEEWAW